MSLLTDLLTRKAVGDISLDSSVDQVVELWGEAALKSNPRKAHQTVIWKYGDLELWFNNKSEMRLMAFFFERSFSNEGEFSLPASSQSFTSVPLPDLEQCREEIARLSLPFIESTEFETLEIAVPSAQLKLRFDESDFKLRSIYQEHANS